MAEPPVVSVQIPPELRWYTSGRGEVTASGETLAEVLDSLGHFHPEIVSRLKSEAGEISSAYVVFLDWRNMQSLQGLATHVTGGHLVSIVPVAAA